MGHYSDLEDDYNDIRAVLKNLNLFETFPIEYRDWSYPTENNKKLFVILKKIEASTEYQDIVFLLSKYQASVQRENQIKNQINTLEAELRNVEKESKTFSRANNLLIGTLKCDFFSTEEGVSIS